MADSSSGCTFLDVAALLGRAEGADGVLRLERRRQPVVGVLRVGHVDLEAAVLAQQDERGALVAAARVTDHHHVLNLPRAHAQHTDTTLIKQVNAGGIGSD